MSWPQVGDGASPAGDWTVLTWRMRDDVAPGEVMARVPLTAVLTAASAREDATLGPILSKIRADGLQVWLLAHCVVCIVALRICSSRVPRHCVCQRSCAVCPHVPMSVPSRRIDWRTDRHKQVCTGAITTLVVVLLLYGCWTMVAARFCSSRRFVESTRTIDRVVLWRLQAGTFIR